MIHFTRKSTPRFPLSAPSKYLSSISNTPRKQNTFYIYIYKIENGKLYFKECTYISYTRNGGRKRGRESGQRKNMSIGTESTERARIVLTSLLAAIKNELETKKKLWNEGKGW